MSKGLNIKKSEKKSPTKTKKEKKQAKRDKKENDSTRMKQIPLK